MILTPSTSETELTCFQQNTCLKRVSSTCVESRGDDFWEENKSNTQSIPMIKKYSDRQMLYKEVLSQTGKISDHHDEWIYVIEFSFHLNLKCCLYIFG